MSHRLFLIALVTFCVACVHHPTNEERIDRIMAKQDAKNKKQRTELEAMQCVDTRGEVERLRTKKSDTDRLNRLLTLFLKLRKRSEGFAKMTSQNTDLLYAQGFETVILWKQDCDGQYSEARVDLEMTVRDDIRASGKGGNSRVDAGLLREALQALKLDDEESLTKQLNAAQGEGGGNTKSQSAR